MMNFSRGILFKRNACLVPNVGYILLLGMLIMVLPIRGMEAVCLAQTAALEQPVSQTVVKPGQLPFSASPTTISPPQLLSAPASVSRRGQFSLNFDDADVYSIIQTIFGEILKVNYVVDPRVKGRVTFRAVAPVSFESVLPLMEVIFRLNGIGVVEDSGLYRLVPISDISKEPSPISIGRDPNAIQATGKAMVQVVPISYITTSEMLKLITPFASTNAVLIDVPKGKQIIIVDTDANVKRLLRLVDVFDNESLKRKKPEVFVYQVQNSKARDVATLLQQVFLGSRMPTTGFPSSTSSPAPAYQTSTPTGPGSPAVSAMSSVTASSYPYSISPGMELLVADTTKIIYDEITNTIIILCAPEDYVTIKKTIEQIDIVPRQVIIEGMIASVSLGDNLSLGLAALFKGSVNGYDTSIGINPGGLSVNPAALTQAGFTFLASDAAGVVRGLITALATQSRAKVLAAPHLLVSDNRDAKIQVGQQVPLLTSETYGAVGVTPQRNYQYRDIGIILKVKPRINEGGLVSLEISQEISTFEKITLGGSEQILLNKTDVATNLVVQDGQTIVIGGLIREDTNKTSSGIPFLSKIPFLGWLFGGSVDDKKRQELIILLTPHVIKNQKEAKDLSSEYIDNMSEASEARIKKEELIKGKTQRREEVAKPPETSGNIAQPKP